MSQADPMSHADVMSQAEPLPTEATGPAASGKRPAGAGAGDPQDSSRPLRIGRYRILEEIGRGGMGVVYLAEQLEPVRRQVALKLLHPHEGTRHAERFHDECQTLARMRHPNIAQMIDAGETDDGHPFLVLEYIDGERLTDFCDHHRLGIRARLELFIKVCDGIQHAHQKGVIHRDLKPSNILVTEQDNQPVPKVIDFGVAKLIDSTRALTHDNQLVGSPSHMSPEQLQGTAADIDTRTDVYALGNVLYELLTGTMVFFAASGSFYDYLVQITRDAVRPPSVRCQDLGRELSAIAQRRQTSSSGLIHCLRGDLDAVVLKALAKQRNDRYPSASGLAADLGRHLDGFPVTAHPGGRGYQVRKLLARHKVPVIAAGLVALALGIATVATSVSLTRAQAAERRAHTAAERTRTVNRILEQILSSPDPEFDGKDVTLLAVLDRTAKEVTADLGDQPEAAASVLHVLGRTYTALGVYPKAKDDLTRALALREKALGLRHDDTLATREALARYRLAAGELDQAEVLARKQVALASATRGEISVRSLSARQLLGQVLYARGRYQAAEVMLRAAYDGFAHQLGSDHPKTLAAHLALGKTLNRLGETDAAEAIFRSVLQTHERQLGADHPRTLESANLLASSLYETKRYQAAEALYRATLERASKRLGDNHPYTLKLRMNVANAVYKQGHYREAEALFRQVLDRESKRLGPIHPNTLLTLNNLGNALRRQSRLAAAEDAYREAMVGQRKVLGRGHVETLRSTVNLINVLEKGGRHAAALALIEEALVDHPESINLWRFKAMVEEALGRLHAATEAATKAVQLAPIETGDLLRHARLLALEGRSSEAWTAYRKAFANVADRRQAAESALERLRTSADQRTLSQELIAKLERVGAEPEVTAALAINHPPGQP